MTASIRYDPFAPDVRENPYPYYAELRRQAPVYHVESAGLWTVARYDDVLTVLKDHQSFSSAPMNFEAVRGNFFEGNAATIIGSDPPIHTRLRNLVNRGFTPRRIAALEPRIRAITEGLLAQIPHRRQFDLIAHFAIPLPVTVIAEMLGVEPDRHADFKQWSDSVVTLISGAPTEEQRTLLYARLSAFRDYFLAVVDGRRAHPRDDLISVLVRAHETEHTLTAEEVIAFAALLLVAGNETTTNLIGNAVLALLDHPEELAKVRANPALVPNLVEEVLRYDAPVQGLFRVATRDVTVADTAISAGALVMPLFASANRDERQFPEPDRFYVTREAEGHIAFGFGIHYCLGAALARLEARIALEALLFRFPHLGREQGRVERIESMFLRGPKRLELTTECRPQPGRPGR
jgi:cytochrome P450